MLRLAAVLLILLTACLFEERGRCGDGDRDGDAGVEECDDGNNVGGDGCSSFCMEEDEVNLEWQLFATVDAPATRCREGVTTVDVVVRSIDAEWVTSSSCGAGSAHAWKRYFGQSVFAQLRDANGDVVATSLPTAARFAVAKFYETAGYLHPSWEFRNAAGQNISCESFTTMPVVVEITPPGGATITKSFDCPGPRAGYSDPLPAGLYDVKVHTAKGDFTQSGVVISPNNGITDLPMVFTI